MPDYRRLRADVQQIRESADSLADHAHDPDVQRLSELVLALAATVDLLLTDREHLQANLTRLRRERQR